MCPACLAAAALLAAKVASADGVAAIFTQKFRTRIGATDVLSKNNAKENKNG
jgi:hypothetical protein